MDGTVHYPADCVAVRIHSVPRCWGIDPPAADFRRNFADLAFRVRKTSRLSLGAQALLGRAPAFPCFESFRDALLAAQTTGNTLGLSVALNAPISKAPDRALRPVRG